MQTDFDDIVNSFTNKNRAFDKLGNLLKAGDVIAYSHGNKIEVKVITNIIDNYVMVVNESSQRQFGITYISIENLKERALCINKIFTDNSFSLPKAKHIDCKEKYIFIIFNKKSKKYMLILLRPVASFRPFISNDLIKIITQAGLNINEIDIFENLFYHKVNNYQDKSSWCYELNYPTRSSKYDAITNQLLYFKDINVSSITLEDANHNEFTFKTFAGYSSYDFFSRLVLSKN